MNENKIMNVMGEYSSMREFLRDLYDALEKKVYEGSTPTLEMTMWDESQIIEILSKD